MGEDGALVKTKLLFARVKNAHAQNVGGKEVGSELETLELGVDGTGEGFGECGFACARIIFEQDVAAGGEGGKNFPEGVPLAANDLFNIGNDLLGND